MTVNQLLQEMTWRLGNRGDISPRTLTWLNDAYFELLLSPRFTYFQLDKRVLWTAQANTRVYTLSTWLPDLWFILNVRNEFYQQKLVRKDPSEFDRTWWTNGMPLRYTRFDDQMELDPIPDIDYDMSLRYRTRPPELVNGGNHLLTREWDEVLTTMAVKKGWEALEQWDKATGQNQMLEMQLARRFDAFQMDDADSEPTIGVRYGS